MSGMFRDASSFNQPLISWDVSSVTAMSAMFDGASSFNQPLISWDVSSVTAMNDMFDGASSFNQPLISWDISSVTDMSYMFNGASSFNQPLSSWDVSSVTAMTDMFDGATAFEQNLGKWYINLDDASIRRADIPGIVGTISAQNSALGNHSPTYAIVNGSGDASKFSIASTNMLNMTSADTKPDYTVNVTATGTDVFGSGNNWRALNITVGGFTSALSTDSAPLTNAASIMVTVEFGNAIDASTFAIPDIEVTGGTASGLSPISGGKTFAFTLAPTADGNVTASIPADRVQDNMGSNNTASNTITITFDLTAPVITIAGQQQVVLDVGAVYDDAGATCADGRDGALAVDTSSDVIDTATPGRYSVTYSCTDEAGNRADATRSVIVSPPITVDAGVDQSVNEGSTVTLRGTASHPDGSLLTYEWSVASRGLPGVTLAAGPDLYTATFAAPKVPSDTPYIFRLTVSDGTNSVSDTVVVTVLDVPGGNSPPAVNAGSDQTASEGSTVTLSGTARDSDGGDIITYLWSQASPADPVVAIADPASRSTTFAAPKVSSDTAFVFRLTVSDGQSSAYDAVTVTILDSSQQPNGPPTVDAGPDQAASEGASITLSGSATDPDGDALTYRWSQVPPADPPVILAGTDSRTATFAAPQVSSDTVFTFMLEVSDGTATASDYVRVTVRSGAASANSPPAVDAGSWQAVSEGFTVSLSGSATDPDGDTLTYLWSHIDPPRSGLPAISFSDPTSPSTTFVAPEVARDEVFTIRLTVSDGTATASGVVIITVVGGG